MHYIICVETKVLKTEPGSRPLIIKEIFRKEIPQSRLWEYLQPVEVLGKDLELKYQQEQSQPSR